VLDEPPVPEPPVTAEPPVALVPPALDDVEEWSTDPVPPAAVPPTALFPPVFDDAEEWSTDPVPPAALVPPVPRDPPVGLELPVVPLTAVIPPLEPVAPPVVLDPPEGELRALVVLLAPPPRDWGVPPAAAPPVAAPPSPVPPTELPPPVSELFELEPLQPQSSNDKPTNTNARFQRIIGRDLPEVVWHDPTAIHLAGSHWPLRQARRCKQCSN
jgi:hypothetical protein